MFLYAALFVPLYMLLGAWPRRGDCCGGPWKASEEEGRDCSIVTVLEDVMGRVSTSAMESVECADRSEWWSKWISGVGVVKGSTDII